MTSLPAPTWKSFLRYVIPSLGAMVLFSSYTVIDGIFVAKGVSDLALAAVNLSLPFLNILSGLSVLLTMGTSTLCAFALGSGDHKGRRRSSPRPWSFSSSSPPLSPSWSASSPGLWRICWGQES